MNRRTLVQMLVSGGVSAAMILFAAVVVRGIGASVYDEYRMRGGQKGFWSWFAKDACGLPLPDVVSDEEETEQANKAAKKRALDEHQTRAREMAKRVAYLERKAERLRKALAKSDAKGSAAGGGDGPADKAGKRKASKSRSGGGSVKTGGKSAYRAGDGRTPYRVAGIRGIEFGSSDNAPGEGVKPVLSVAVDESGNMDFRQLRWRENKKLTEPVYGFDKAYLNHSYDTEQLSSVTFHKEFPFTEEGLKQATEFYRTMSAEASQDLGFEVIDIDRTGNLKSATVCEFRNGDGDTSIRGAINAWSDKSLTVSFSVTDKAYSSEAKAQSEAAYRSGEANRVDARIEVVNQDHTARKERINAFLDER